MQASWPIRSRACATPGAMQDGGGMNVLDVIAGLARAGKISAAMADEAAAVYRGALVDMDPSAAALKTADFLRAKARARRSVRPGLVDDPRLDPGRRSRDARAMARGPGRTPGALMGLPVDDPLSPSKPPPGLTRKRRR